MANKRKTTRDVKKTNKKSSPYALIMMVFIIISIVVLFLAFLSATAYHAQQNEIKTIQHEILPKVVPTAPTSMFYNLKISPNFNGGMCATMVNSTCMIEEVNMSQQNVFEINDTYSGNYSMDIFITPPGKVSLTMIIDYADNNTQNTLVFNNMSGTNVFSGPQVPSTIKLIFTNEGSSFASGYLKIDETPSFIH